MGERGPQLEKNLGGQYENRPNRTGLGRIPETEEDSSTGAGLGRDPEETGMSMPDPMDDIRKPKFG